MENLGDLIRHAQSEVNKSIRAIIERELDHAGVYAPFDEKLRIRLEACIGQYLLDAGMKTVNVEAQARRHEKDPEDSWSAVNLFISASASPDFGFAASWCVDRFGDTHPAIYGVTESLTLSQWQESLPGFRAFSRSA
ncbi:MAG: hypothetical protein ACREDR_00210 [Blastocatellia bacterium]